MASHGAGALSRSIKSRSAWSENDFKLHGKLHVSKNGEVIFFPKYVLPKMFSI